MNKTINLVLMILMAALYAREALQFSVFPSLLLLTTLFRLGLDISATRLILLEANAGDLRVQWDVPVKIEAGETARVELSNLNSTGASGSKP